MRCSPQETIQKLINERYSKSIIRYLHQDNPDLAREFSESFNQVFKAGYARALT